MKSLKRAYGWKRDLPDQRDAIFKSFILPKDLLPSVDLRYGLGQVYNQGPLGSCTANAIASAFQYALKREKKPEFDPSRLFLYYNERAMEGNIESDSGATIRDGIKSINTTGICSEQCFPYNVAMFKAQPGQTCYSEAAVHKVSQYARIEQNLVALKSCLAEEIPIVFGFTVYEQFESDEAAQTGIVKMPGFYQSMLGGHATLIAGYDDSTRLFTVRNSWGEEWGDNGNFYMPYEYVTNPNLASDFWAINFVTG